jgi:hypothetical protein
MPLNPLNHHSICRPITVLVIVLWSLESALACKYSVRDVGFVRIEQEPYRVFVCVDGAESLAAVRAQQLTIRNALIDTGMAYELVDVRAAPDDPAVELLVSSEVTTFPRAVLSAPDGRLLKVSAPIPTDSSGITRDFHKSFRNLVESPLRDRLRDYALERECFVLVIDGSDNAMNRRARSVAESAIAELENHGKDASGSPGRLMEMVVVSRKQARDEEILLWSLGVDFGNAADTHIVVVFGRLRRLGPPLTFPGATQADLVNRLRYVGRSCECELDRSWLQGPAVPHRWSFTLREQAIELLGFDPESGVVRSEVARVLMRGKTAGRRNLKIGLEPAGDPLLGYSEFAPMEVGPPNEIDSDLATPAKAPTADSSNEDMVRTPDFAPGYDGESSQRSVNSTERWSLSPAVLWTIAAALIVLVVSCGGFVLTRSKRRP